MLYVEYCANVGGIEKKLGLLGESHMYTSEESDFAREVVERYTTVGIEYGRKVGVAELLTSVTVAPLYLYLNAATKRKIRNKIAGRMAKEQGKEVIWLETGYALPLGTAALFALGTTAASLSLLTKTGREKMKAVMHQREDLPHYRHKYGAQWGKTSSNPFIQDQGLVANRDKNMAARAKAVLDMPLTKDILINTGEAHLPGIIKELRRKYILAEVGRATPYEGIDCAYNGLWKLWNAEPVDHCRDY